MKHKFITAGGTLPALAAAATLAVSPAITPVPSLAGNSHCSPHAGGQGGHHPRLASINGALLARYFDWQMGDGADGGRLMKFLPLPEGEEAGGSFTYDDPGILVGEETVTLKAGQSFLVPIVSWIGEVYEDGSEDEPLTEAVMNESEFRATIDGHTVAHKAAGRSSLLYGAATDFDDPILYEAPSDYGSTGAVWVQGFPLLHGPLAPGRHVMKLHSTLMIEDLDLGLQFENTWIITVKR